MCNLISQILFCSEYIPHFILGMGDILSLDWLPTRTLGTNYYNVSVVLLPPKKIRNKTVAVTRGHDCIEEVKSETKVRCQWRRVGVSWIRPRTLEDTPPKLGRTTECNWDHNQLKEIKLTNTSAESQDIKIVD
jgi:hypothetical protein